MSLARGIQQKLQELQDLCRQAVSATERSGIRHPAHTVTGKVEQAQRWLANPAVSDSGLGMSFTQTGQILMTCDDVLLFLYVL